MPLGQIQQQEMPRDDSFRTKKQEQWAREKESEQPEWFPFVGNESPGCGNPNRRHEARDYCTPSPGRLVIARAQPNPRGNIDPHFCAKQLNRALLAFHSPALISARAPKGINLRLNLPQAVKRVMGIWARLPPPSALGPEALVIVGWVHTYTSDGRLE
ncbi:unnamed protein product, partial [Mesorhabditis spiculigera]